MSVSAVSKDVKHGVQSVWGSETLSTHFSLVRGFFEPVR